MARLAYFFEPVGQLSLYGFAKRNQQLERVRTLSASDAQARGFPIDPAYANYQITGPFNAEGIVRFRSAELAYSQALSFLPGVLRGLNLNTSYTRTTVNARHPDTSPHVVAAASATRTGATRSASARCGAPTRRRRPPSRASFATTRLAISAAQCGSPNA